MHVGHAAIFQSPHNANGVTDYQNYQEDYEHYQQQAETHDADGVVDLFLSVQVYGSPEQCYARACGCMRRK